MCTWSGPLQLSPAVQLGNFILPLWHFSPNFYHRLADPLNHFQSFEFQIFGEIVEEKSLLNSTHLYFVIVWSCYHRGCLKGLLPRLFSTTPTRLAKYPVVFPLSCDTPNCCNVTVTACVKLVSSSLQLLCADSRISLGFQAGFLPLLIAIVQMP